MPKKPVAVIILDGLGCREEDDYNAVNLAETPYLDHLWQTYPHTTIAASGEAVGLPAGQIGNSEVGHTNIGAGRVVYQSLTRINKAIEEGDFQTNPVLLQALDHAKDQGSRLQLFGLVSDGRVHSDQNHLYAILKLAKDRGLAPDQVCVHVATDGRDVAPDSGLGHVQALQEFLDELGVGQIASLSGRYYAMDRDNRWDRIERAYDAIVKGEAPLLSDPVQAVQASYDNGVYDEFIEPVVFGQVGEPLPQIEDGDSVLFFNFRSDRVRQLSRALLDEDFDAFDRGDRPTDLLFTTMMDYGDQVESEVIFQPLDIDQPLGQVAADAGLSQLRIAETEKYPHVTYFMNGGKEIEFQGEDRSLIPSPKVDTYDLKPEMSAYEIADDLVEKIEADRYDLIILNFANPDMVGHSGILQAAIKAVEAVDENLQRVVDALLAKNGVAIVFADHGNAERMQDEEGKPHTAHTTAQVPVIITQEGLDLKEGCALCDIAPTALDLLGLDQPQVMTGQSIIKEKGD